MSPTRRQYREAVFQYLYGHLPRPSEALPEPWGTYTEVESFCRHFEYPMDEFCYEVIQGTGKNLSTIDEQISKLSTNWKVERMPRVDLTLLRMASFEILYRSDIPKTVSINEAIELGKKFGAEDSAGFINGILDKLDKLNKPS